MKKIFPVLFTVLWILLVLIGYYWGHKPFQVETFQSLISVLLDFVYILFVLGFSGGVGRRLLKHIELSSLEQIAIQSAAGLGVFSLIWLLLGAFSLYYQATGWVVLFVGLLVFRDDVYHWMKEFNALNGLWRGAGRMGKILLLSLVFLIAIQILFALAPPIKYDALSYHLQLPRVYQETHRLIFTPENPYWGHPQAAEMLFTWMVLLHRPETAAILSASWGILLVLGLIGTVHRMAYKNTSGSITQTKLESKSAALAGIISGFVLLSGMTFRYMFSWSYVDIFSALMGWAVILCAMTAVRSKDWKWVLWAGIFSGFAIGSKWTAGIIVLGVFPYLFFVRKKINLTVSQLLLSLLAAGVLVIPWVFKNTVVTGNPFYPYFLPTKWIDSQRLIAASSMGHPMSLMDSLLFPFTSTIFGWDSAPGYGSDLGPFLLLFCIPGLWFMRKLHEGKMVFFCLLICWGAIAFGSLFFNHLQQTRLFFVLLPGAALAAGFGWYGLYRLEIPELRISRLLEVLLLLVLGLILLQDLNWLTNLSPVSIILGVKEKEDYLDNTLGWYAPAMRGLYELPQGSKTLMLWEARGLYAPDGTLADPWIDRWRVDYWAYQTPERIKRAWLAQGISHLLFYKRGADMIHEGGSPLDEAGWQVLDDLLAGLPPPISFGDVYTLYPLLEE